MTTKSRSFPSRGGELGPFADRYVDQLETHPNDYHVDNTRTQALKERAAAYSAAYAAQLAAQDSARAATQDKDAAQAALLEELGSISRFVKGNDLVTNAALERLGLAPRSSHRTPVPRPTTFPLADVMNTACVEHTLTIINPDSKTRRGKPNGVIGCEIYVAVGPTVPTDQAAYRLVSVSTRGTEVVTFNGNEGGQTAHYRLRWVNSKGQPGPFSPVFSATIPAV